MFFTLVSEPQDAIHLARKGACSAAAAHRTSFCTRPGLSPVGSQILSVGTNCLDTCHSHAEKSPQNGAHGLILLLSSNCNLYLYGTVRMNLLYLYISLHIFI